MNIFEGSPKDKFFDIIFNANRNLVEEKIEQLVTNFVALSAICEKNGIDVSCVDLYVLQNLDEIQDALNDYFMEFTSNVLSNNE